MMERGAATADGLWYLEGFAPEGREMLRTPVRPLPFRIGRRPQLELSLKAASVSQEHAEIFARDGCLWVRDLGSTNGTFLNRSRLTDSSRLREGDILHFADQEFRLIPGALAGADLGTLQLQKIQLPRRLLGSARELLRLIDEGAFQVLFQPIVELATGERVGYETLGRGASPELPEHPGELFALAASVGLEHEVSRAFRRAAMEACRSLPPGTAVFLNTHPGELAEPEALLDSLRPLEIREPGGPSVVLEIHEAAVTDPRRMQELRQALRELGVGLAYDDFGAGRARLLELIDVPPDYLKFDISLVRDLDRAASGRRRMISTLVGMARELRITSVAEGVERPEEAQAAREIGFDLAQGYLFGRPAAL